MDAVEANRVPAVAFAGYTNAGKSSLMNRLTGAGVLVDNSLFATLDPTVRKAHTSDGRLYTLADTVGFVRHLPHQLVEAFRSTLDEVTDADLVLHVVDGSDPDPERQLTSVREVLAEIGAENLPEIVVINKADLADPLTVARLRRREPGAVTRVGAHRVSASTSCGCGSSRQLPHPPVDVEVSCPTTAATWSRACTPRARCSSRSTASALVEGHLSPALR